MGRELLNISRQQGELLQTLPWPGNIRELRNVLERAVILSKGSRLRLDLALPDQGPTASLSQSDNVASFVGDFLTDAGLPEKEKANLIVALNHAQWRIAGSEGAAELPGIKPSTLTCRMKAIEIEKP